jgi:hypothetical protein
VNSTQPDLCHSQDVAWFKIKKRKDTQKSRDAEYHVR